MKKNIQLGYKDLFLFANNIFKFTFSFISIVKRKNSFVLKRAYILPIENTKIFQKKENPFGTGYIRKTIIVFLFSIFLSKCSQNISNENNSTIAFESYLLRVSNSISSNISNSNSYTVSITPTSGLTTSESGTTAKFTVVLSAVPSSNVLIPISSSNTNEGKIDFSSLTFTPTNWNIPQTVTVTGVDDFIVDGNISYSILTGAVTSSDLNYNGLNPPDVTLTNTDNDSPGISVSSISGNTSEAGTTANFTIVLNSQPTSIVGISISSSNSAEGTVTPTGISFTSANWNTPQTITVTGVNDSIADGDISYSIITNSATSSDPLYNGINPADLSLTNIDVGEKRTFVSSSTSIGNLSGITGADSICNSDAAKPTIVPNVYKAMIVDGTNRKASATANAGDGQINWVLLPNTIYFRSNGTTQIMTTNANSIFIFGALTNSFEVAAVPYWTGLNTDWTTSANTCSNWASMAGNGQVGQATPTTNASISGAASPCNMSVPYLLCVQQ